jgi:hypothetical protein
MSLAALPADVLRALLARLSLWDARSLQHAHPDMARLVHDHVADVVAGALRSARPRLVDAVLDTFLNASPGFQERACPRHNITATRTPRDVTMHAACGGGVVVVLTVLEGPTRARRWGRVEVRTTPPPPSGRPGFDALERTLRALWWFAQALEERGVETSFRTRALVHHPPSEVLNTLATAFVERHCEHVTSPGTGGP